MKEFVPSLLVCALFVGCTSSYQVSQKPDSLSVSVKIFNENLEGKSATISFEDGRVLETSQVSLLPDNTQATVSLDSNIISVPASEVLKINAANHGKGALDGLGIGALAGSVTGLCVLYWIKSGDRGREPIPLEGYAWMCGTGALFGGIFGTLAGYSISHSDVYTIDANEGDKLSITVDSTEESPNRITLEIAGFPHLGSQTGSWYPRIGLRGGYGVDVVGPLELRAFFEYDEFAFDPRWGMSYAVYSEGHRRDYALYGSVLWFTVLEVAFGGYYTHQDQIIYNDRWSGTQGMIVVYPALSYLRLYFHIGMSGRIHVLGPVSLPLGMFFRNESGIGFRTGAVISF